MTDLSHRVQSLLRMTMTDVADAADELGDDVLRLENADTYLTPPAHVLDATRRAVGLDDYNSYLPLRGLGELRAAIAARYAADWGLTYDADREIVVSCGAGESMLNALLALVDPGDRVLLTDPTYSGMAQRVRVAGGVQVFTPLQRRGGRWALDVDDLRERARGCKVIFVASPSLPTGTIFTAGEVAAIAEAALENDAWLIFNGAADKVAFDGRTVTNPAALPGVRERTIVIGCMSKNYAMPGWRVGWALGPRDVMTAMENLHIFNGIMASGFAQAGAAAALSGPQDWQRETVAVYARGQAALLDAIAASGRLSAVPAEGGYFCLLDTEGTGLPAVEFAQRLLDEERVAVTPMQGWGSDDFGEHVVRLIFTNEPEARLREAGRRIAAFAERQPQ
ncbi:MAG TPA: pyridoxal phosphate-dependent aminotransferase [Solirubrobacter sp.]|nr:pyridoxal phosphate-dependent aminotransferase [Solirubrobacter sp.]